MANNQSVRRRLDAFTRGRIIGKLKEGCSVTSVAAEFGIAHSIVSRLWRQFQTTGTAIRGSVVVVHEEPHPQMSGTLSYRPEETGGRQREKFLEARLMCYAHISLREAGWSNRRIGRHLGGAIWYIARCWQQWITEGRVYRRGGSGRPRNTNDREDRAIRRVATSAPTTSLASIQRHLPPSRHSVPSRETIRRRLTEVGLRSRRPLRRLPLTPHHRQCRLDFADLGQLGV
ncbi:HTH_Tnp_Tc3_2 domain-containing protein [Trichonephila clavipes]|nr:HTH_Tnp_Tc3_2 domain-containing protein [Trichonephila clavipes]